MSLKPTDQPPYFQQLQQQFAQHIRDPQNSAYAPQDALPIESRRLGVYQQLFFNNIDSFFSQIFPVSQQILGESRWHELIREYMVKHKARTPLFHRLGEEFLDFLQTEFTPQESDPKFLLELAHYEWVELALSVSSDEGFSPLTEPQSQLDLDQAYQLSAVAWPLAYEWPVHQLSDRFRPADKPDQVTTLLVYRGADDRIDFMALTPLLYQWLITIDEAESARSSFEQLALTHGLPSESVVAFGQEVLMQLHNLNIVRGR